MVDFLALIAEPNRRKIMRIVWNEEKSAGDIARQFDLTFGAVSQHLHVLREAGLVAMRKAGRSHFYHARKEALGPFAKALEAMWSDALDRLKFAAESEATTYRKKGATPGRTVAIKKPKRSSSQRKST